MDIKTLWSDGMISLSYSRLNVAKQCLQRFWYSYLDPARVYGDKQNEFGKDGSDKHLELEHYLKGEGPLPMWVRSDGTHDFRAAIERCKEEGYVAEEETAFTEDWIPTAWRSQSARWRVKIDAQKVEESVARVRDWKTGKILTSGWLDQCELYAIATMHLHPDVDVVEVELWYLLHDHKSRATFRRSALPRLERKYLEKAQGLEARTEWPKNPGPLCAYCPFHQSKGGPCSG
jgi:PD-(D/E)XK nuclease superfamily